MDEKISFMVVADLFNTSILPFLWFIKRSYSTFYFFYQYKCNSTQNIPDTDIEFRRTEPTTPLAQPIILFALNDMGLEQIASLPFTQKSLELGVHGTYPVYPIKIPIFPL